MQQPLLDLGAHRTTNPKLQSVLNYIDEKSTSSARKGILFERLMRQYFLTDPLYEDRFSEVYLYKEWASLDPSRNPRDLGIDLVAVEPDGTFCAIQCKCYAPTTHISKPDIDSFIAESSRSHFTARIIVDTGGSWGDNAEAAIKGIDPPCKVIRFRDLERSPINWPDLSIEPPENLSLQEPFKLKSHQQNAFDDVVEKFKYHDRGKMIMACGTGKTFVSLRIAEEIAGEGGLVLYLVPSIALLGQAMREWAEQKQIPHRYIGICSDTTAGRTNEDMRIEELEIPVTTDHIAIGQELSSLDSQNMTVVFSTYHSLPIVEKGISPLYAKANTMFDLILCDEAHRTTGIQRANEDVTHFRLVHDNTRIRAQKRLYMTATPKIYTESAYNVAAQHRAGVYSMDDEETFGPEFHHLPFSKAVEIGELTDYKVTVIAISESEADAALQAFYQSGGSEISITDATKIVGCWRALQNPERKPQGDETIKPIRSAIAFTNRIAESKRIQHFWNDIIDKATQEMPEETLPENFTCQIDHVDGTVSAINRKAKLEWLRYPREGECKILSNAKCLSEGIDVPALDAVMFMAPRQSQVDIVQAVGRVMRIAEGKKDGYIILPVAIPEGVDPADALDNNERFATIWSVLRALRSHDDRFNAEINKIDLNNNPTDRIIFDSSASSGTEGTEETRYVQPPLLPLSFPADKMFAQIVERCGDRRYLESWAKDVADIFKRLVSRIKRLLDNPQNDALKQGFKRFHTELQKTINKSITENNAIDMIAQHILTNPVFEALFEEENHFTQNNPVSRTLETLHTELQGYGLENETRDLKSFYESVQRRAQGIDNPKGRQTVLIELYQKFFVNALKKEAERLGIVYTPIEVVDFILHSADEVLQQEFGKRLTDEGVHILDPFTGTGTFIVQLLQSKLIDDSDLLRKYHNELHANEMVLLAYYIAAVNIEETFRGRLGESADYQPFEKIVFTDTFNLNKDEEPTLFPKQRMADNSTRAEQQQKLPIRVIMGNPPWSAGQKSSADNNPNVKYPNLAERIKETYVKHSTAKLKNSLYDTYKMAIRWASDKIDRVEEKGIIAFVTNGSWIDGNADSGIRACFEKEFSSIYVLHLRGNARTSGERRRSEGGNVFGMGSRAPVTVTILVNNSNAAHERCQIYYRDIGDYLTREEKLEILSEAESIKGFTDWREITPDKYYDWVEQRKPIFETFYQLGTKDEPNNIIDNTIFRLFSSGYKTSRDAYIYNYSRDACAYNAQLMVQDYIEALSDMEEDPQMEAGAAARQHASNVRWDRELVNNLRRGRTTEFDESYIRYVLYRPFVKTNCYTDFTFANCKYQQDIIFPYGESENRAICVPGIGGKKSFSVLMTNIMPDLGLNEACQCFPRYRYKKAEEASDTTQLFEDTEEEFERIDNITDTALRDFQEHYEDSTITKDTIFDYVYGILHAPDYREEFAYDLTKMLPRIPYAKDFHVFAKAGSELAVLHLNYETCEQYLNLRVEPLNRDLFWEESQEHFVLGTRSMKFADDNKTTLILNEHVCLAGIPLEAHQYVVNGRTPLEWFIDRYKIKQDTESMIVNDPNGWFENPRDIVTAIERIVQVSVESTKIIENLPSIEWKNT